jgi:8-oxo-dGTP pyrophosphatase MutT (NUDIX family)
MIDMHEIEKVYAYITCGEMLLVFRHVDFPEAGIQVPGGTMETGEDAAKAVLREVEEESGLTGMRVNAFMGNDVYLEAPNKKLVRHFFHLIWSKDTMESWRHYEHTPSDGTPGPILFEFFWLPLDEAAASLEPYFVAGLERLATSGTDRRR